MENYNPFIKTAITRKTMSSPTKYLLKHNLLKSSILDYGCGKGKDVEELKLLGFDIKGYDKFNDMYNTKLNKYETIICNYVFNVIYDLKEHYKTVEKLKKMSKNVYISLRNDKKSIKNDWKYIKNQDCYKTSKNSYQRFYTNESIKKYFGKVKIINENNTYILLKLL